MNIYKHELRLALSSAMVYLVVIPIIGLIFIGLYPAFAQDSEQMVKMIQQFPKEVIAAFGIDPATIFTFDGFYAYIYLFISIILGVAGMNSGIIAYSRENIDKTADFLLTKPVSRIKLASIKIAASITYMILLNVFTTAILYGVTKIFGNETVDVTNFIMVSFGGLMISLMFAALGYLLANLFWIKNPGMVTAGGVSFFYLMTTLSNLTEEKKYEWLSPFRYYDSTYILFNKAFEMDKLIISVLIIIVFAVVSVMVYNRRDIRQV
jgi:ABC-2 type transport system permease protein